ncbi:Glutathione S-transferase U17 [Linum perenne]
MILEGETWKLSKPASLKRTNQKDSSLKFRTKDSGRSEELTTLILFRQIEEELLLFDKLPHQKLPSNTLEQFGTKSELLLKLDHVYKKIPILIHNDRPICESNIIVEYIDEAWSSGPSLLPSDAYDRAMPTSRLPTSTKR